MTFLMCANGYAVFSQIGNQFPYMEAETLTNKLVNIPKDIEKKYSLIGLAYSKKAEKDLKTWFDPVYNQFIYKNPNPSPFDFSFDIHAYFIPMFTGVKKAAYNKVMKKLRKTIDKRLQANILFYKGSLKTYKKALNFDGKDVPYFYILNPEGEIIYSTSGRYTKKKMQEIIDIVDSSMTMKN